MKKLSAFLCALTLVGGAYAQQTKPQRPANAPTVSVPSLPTLQKPNAAAVPAAAPILTGEVQLRGVGNLVMPSLGLAPKATFKDGDLPIVIEGEMPFSGEVGEAARAYLGYIGALLPLENAAAELVVSEVKTDDLGITHVKLQQYFGGLRVHGAEARLQARDGKFYRYNGRIYPTPTGVTSFEGMSGEALMSAVRADLPNYQVLTGDNLKLVGGTQQQFELVIYHPQQNPAAEILCYHMSVYANVHDRWEYFVDAQTGSIVHKFRNVCQMHGGTACAHPHEAPKTSAAETNYQLPEWMPFDGPATANATDLSGTSRLINTYLSGSKYYLIDASRPMFNQGQSSFPNDAVGVILTANGNNTSPQGNFNATHVTSANNSWNNAKAVSAHYNAGEAYKYFKNTFNRNSINGQGGNIVSFINVSESNGADMDNAFWNGQAMFYGNGNDYFTPLAEALDVAGHEMSHGVIEKTANLEYQGESGALNESFADIFGAMIDRDDWRMGEDVVLTSVFPSGALRSLQDPHNGGSNLNDTGWQPKHMNEKYTGSQDNGGVHINSGITNYAFYLFASNASVGKDKAERVWYRALDQYLVMSSKFIDLRASVIQAINDLNYGSAVINAADNAFNSVGIGSGGSAGGEVYQQNLPTNPGSDYILFSDPSQSNMWVQTPSGALQFNPLSGTNQLSRMSITDAGNEMVFVAADNTLHYIFIDWATNTPQESILSSDPIWRNVAISKDGWKLAAITTDYDNTISVYDFVSSQWGTYSLYNPTTANGGNVTNDVQYADVLEFDYSGQWVMYDAFNEYPIEGGTVSYWDIGFINVWNNATNDFVTTPDIQKLFTGLPENAGVGNPTFSKNSPYIIAFDYFNDVDNEYAVLGVNLETGDQGLIYQNTILGYPNYARLDDRVIFNDGNATGYVISRRNVGSNKITGTGNATALVDDAVYGIWFANGVRDLQINTRDVLAQTGIAAWPNPTRTDLNLAVQAGRQNTAQIHLFDAAGRRIMQQAWPLLPGDNQTTLTLPTLPAGLYTVQVIQDGSIRTQRIAVQ